MQLMKLIIIVIAVFYRLQHSDAWQPICSLVVIVQLHIFRKRPNPSFVQMKNKKKMSVQFFHVMFRAFAW